MSDDVDVDLSSLWLPLLARLTATLPSWGLWKNADTALMGHGDFDSTAPESDWDTITSEFHRWAADNGYTPVAACRHVPGVLFLIALHPRRPTFLELDVNARKYFRGSTVFRPETLLPVMEVDDRGFRRVRPGAEGVILLTQNGTRWGGRPDRAGLERKRVAELLSADPEGVRLTAPLFGPASAALVSAAEGAARGRWDRRAMLVVESWAVVKAVAAPRILLTRFWARRVKKRCPVLRSIFVDNRVIPDDRSTWLDRVARDHLVLGRP